MPTDPDTIPTAAPGPGGSFIGAVTSAVNNYAPPASPPPAAKPTLPNTGAGAGGAPANNPATDAIASWVDAMFEHYLGRPASTTELNTVVSQGWTPDRLTQHLRAQPSYVPGLTIGGYEDLYNVANNEYLKYLGYQPSDQDIRDLATKGIKDQFAVNNYLKNRADVVALHPGAPIDLTDEQFGHWHDQVNAHYQQNLQRDATTDESRDAYNNRQTAAPAQAPSISPQLGLGQQGTLEAKNVLSPTARAV